MSIERNSDHHTDSQEKLLNPPSNNPKRMTPEELIYDYKMNYGAWGIIGGVTFLNAVSFLIAPESYDREAFAYSFSFGTLLGYSISSRIGEFVAMSVLNIDQ